MALISLFFTTNAQLGVLELDCSLNENHEGTATISQSEVEDGSTINDNVVLLPRKLTLEGFVSLTPLGIAGLVGSAGTALAGLAGAKTSAASNNPLVKSAVTTGVASLGGLVASAVGGDAGAKSRQPKDVWDYLDELRVRRLPFQCVTALKIYDNMIMTSVTAPRNKDNTGGLRFTATMEQVKIVTSQVISIANITGASGAADLGKQAAGDAPGPTASNASLLYQGLIGP